MTNLLLKNLINLKNYFITIDADTELELVEKFGIKSVPTFILIDDGKEVSRTTGAKTKEELLSLITEE